MSRIKPRTHGKEFVRHITRLERENHETLFAYARFLGEPTEYIVNQLVQTVLAKDKEFVAWRTQHAESFVPPQPPQTSNRRPAASVQTRALHSTAKSAVAPGVTAG
jgi:hypothetical protein